MTMNIYLEEDDSASNVAETLDAIKLHFYIEVNDFVCISLANENKIMVEINYSHKNGSYYLWPKCISQSWISRKEIHLKLSTASLISSI